MGSLSTEIPTSNWETAIEEIKRGYRLLERVRAFLMNGSKGDDQFGLASLLADEVLQSLTKAITNLKPVIKQPISRPSAATPPLDFPDLEIGLACPSASMSTITDELEMEKEKEEKEKTPVVAEDPNQRQAETRNQPPVEKSVSFEAPKDRQRPDYGEKKISKTKSSKSLDSWTKITSNPHHDGYQWRKYGEKSISKSVGRRCYYRCTYSSQGCPATKTVQQIDCDDLPKFKVTYFKEHTCGAESHHSGTQILEFAPAAAAPPKLKQHTCNAESHRSSPQVMMFAPTDHPGCVTSGSLSD